MCTHLLLGVAGGLALNSWFLARQLAAQRHELSFRKTAVENKLFRLVLKPSLLVVYGRKEKEPQTAGSSVFY